MKNFILILLIPIMALISCKTQEPTTTTDVTEVPSAEVLPSVTRPNAMLPPVIVYKTRGDYDNLVPVTLDKMGARIASYPGPGDVKRGNGFSTPVKLDNGYLYDRRGLSPSSVFTDYTYEEYAALAVPPSTDELMQHIKYRNPFIEMYLVKGIIDPTVEQLNAVIKSGFENCEIIIAPIKPIEPMQ